jgi:hypothetical protein
MGKEGVPIHPAQFPLLRLRGSRFAIDTTFVAVYSTYHGCGALEGPYGLILTAQP